MSTNSERLSNINPEAFNNDKCAHEILLNQLIVAFERIETLEKKIAELERQLQEEPDVNKIAGSIKRALASEIEQVISV